MTDQFQLPSDQALVAQARGGSEAAWNELRARHIGAIQSLARSRNARQGSGAADAAFARLRVELTDTIESDPSAPPQPPVRPRAVGLLTGGAYGPGWGPLLESTSGPDEPVDRGRRVGDVAPPARRELLDVAAAFAALPTVWQAVLWHRWVEQAPAAELTAILGRTPADVVALEQTAHRGLVDGYIETVLAGDPAPDAACVPVIALLGAYRRDALPNPQRRAVEAHLADTESRAGCDTCGRRLDLLDRLPAVVPIAIVPGLTGLGAERYRSMVGGGALAIGASALAARRTDRARRGTRVAAVAAVVLALLAAALFVREPFGDLDSEIADLIERSTTTVPGPTTTVPDPSNTAPTTVPGGQGSSPDELPNRIELIFPGGPQGAVYVPGGRALNLDISLSTPAPVYSGATGTIDAAITNSDTEPASVRFLVRSSRGVSFDRLSEGTGSCVAEQDAGARCTLMLPAGTTGAMSLRFNLDSDVPNRLLVVPSIPSTVLDVPVESVPDLLLGQVDRGELRTAGATLGTCGESPECPSGRRDASTAALEIPEGVAVERALLVWQGDRPGAAWADAVGLIPEGSSTAVTVTAGNVPHPSGTLTTGSGVENSETDAAGFRSVADVTDLVRSAGGGEWTVVRAPSMDEAGDGSWTLTVIIADPTSTRRLLVVLRPGQLIEPDAPLEVVVPVSGSTTPRSAQRSVEFVLQAAVSGSGTSRFAVNGVTVSDDAFDGIGTAGGTVTYAWEIASTEDALSLETSTSADSLKLASIGLAAAIVP